MIGNFIKFMENGYIPDSAIRFGIRQLCDKRLAELHPSTMEEKQEQATVYLEGLRNSPLAIHTNSANDQHYELPADFFLYVLGKNLKYSSCFWNKETENLDEAEDLALEATIERAQIKDGHRILELGCGWGSLTLKMAKKFPNSKIVAISNSSSQKNFIDLEAKNRGLNNITILTLDISKLESLSLGFDSFDRAISIEMFEHFKNYEILLKNISDVLAPNGKLFVHIFTHKDYSYSFETNGEDNWMGKYFFTGGQMPSHNLLYCFQKDLYLDKSWSWDGTHYQKTSNAWLQNMDKNKNHIKKIFDRTYGAESVQWFNRWRIFFMSCAELFGHEKGQQWGVSHYLFCKNESSITK
jgi:cyclopropane-fatty-acyl-phospholipid synthase